MADGRGLVFIQRTECPVVSRRGMEIAKLSARVEAGITAVPIIEEVLIERGIGASDPPIGMEARGIAGGLRREAAPHLQQLGTGTKAAPRSLPQIFVDPLVPILQCERWNRPTPSVGKKSRQRNTDGPCLDGQDVLRVDARNLHEPEHEFYDTTHFRPFFFDLLHLRKHGRRRPAAEMAVKQLFDRGPIVHPSIILPVRHSIASIGPLYARRVSSLPIK